MEDEWRMRMVEPVFEVKIEIVRDAEGTRPAATTAGGSGGPQTAGLPRNGDVLSRGFATEVQLRGKCSLCGGAQELHLDSLGYGPLIDDQIERRK